MTGEGKQRKIWAKKEWIRGRTKKIKTKKYVEGTPE